MPQLFAADEVKQNQNNQTAEQKFSSGELFDNREASNISWPSGLAARKEARCGGSNCQSSFCNALCC